MQRLGRYSSSWVKQTGLKCLAILMYSGAFSSNVKAQDPHFSQYYASPLYLNPALTGMERDLYFGVNYRTQWQSLDFPYKTYQFSVTHPVFTQGSEKIQIGGIGLSVFQDQAGDNDAFKTLGLIASAAYNLRLDNQNTGILSFGLQAGYIQKRIDLNGLNWGSQYNPFIGYDNTLTPDIALLDEGTSYPVFNTGIVYYYNPYKQYYFTKTSGFFGFAMSYLNKPNESLLIGGRESLPVLYKVHGGLEFRLNAKVYLSPNFLLMRQGASNEINLGTYLAYNLTKFRSRKKFKPQQMILGSWYRFGDAFIFTAGVTSNSLSFGLSYDLNVSTLRYNNRGLSAFELSLTYRVVKGKGIKRFSTPLM